MGPSQNLPTPPSKCAESKQSGDCTHTQQIRHPGQGAVTLSQPQDPTGQIFVKSKGVGEGSSTSLHEEHAHWPQLLGSKCSEAITHRPCLQVTIDLDRDGPGWSQTNASKSLG